MKKRTKLIYVGITTLLATYISYSMRYHYVRLPIQYDESISRAARHVIDEWYADAENVPVEKVSFDRIIYALTHPYCPTTNKCEVYHMKFSIVLTNSSGEGYLAVFNPTDDGLMLEGCGTPEDLGF